VQVDSNSPYLLQLFSLIYRVTKLRGYKAIVKLFPHAVADLEPALECLLSQVRARVRCRGEAASRLCVPLLRDAPHG
jgi:hypothetical protein